MRGQLLPLNSIELIVLGPAQLALRVGLPSHYIIAWTTSFPSLLCLTLGTISVKREV